MKLKNSLILEQSKALDYLKVDNEIKQPLTESEAQELKKKRIRVIKEGDTYYHFIKKTDFDEETFTKLVLLKQMNDIKVIKKCILFFTILASAYLVISFIMTLAGISAAIQVM